MYADSSKTKKSYPRLLAQCCRIVLSCQSNYYLFLGVPSDENLVWKVQIYNVILELARKVKKKHFEIVMQWKIIHSNLKLSESFQPKKCCTKNPRGVSGRCSKKAAFRSREEPMLRSQQSQKNQGLQKLPFKVSVPFSIIKGAVLEEAKEKP